MAHPSDGLILCDVGHSRFHILDGDNLRHLGMKEALARYGDKEVHYICVDAGIERTLASLAGWHDLVSRRRMPTAYRGWGIDREAACLGAGEGVVIDAGTALTLDIVRDGRHLGGWIWPGVKRWREAMAGISARLDHEPRSVSALPPLSTAEAVWDALLGSVRRCIECHASGMPVTVTGGDATLVASAIEGARVDERLVFKGMIKMIKDEGC